MKAMPSVVVALALSAACSAGPDAAAAAREREVPAAGLADARLRSDRYDAAAALDELRRRLDHLLGQHRVGDSERSHVASARAGYAKRWPAAGCAGTSDERVRDRLLDLLADEYVLRRMHKYDPRTWVGSEQRAALLAEFDRAAPGNQRQSGFGIRRRIDELRADVFVLESFHRR